MKKIVFTSLFIILLIPFNLCSQSKGTDPVILTIDNQKVTKSEFLRIYHKNNSQANPDSKSLHEYMDMFINYKLKVIEAEHLGYDTASAFIKEFTSYRDQLAKPYLVDTVIEDKLYREAYKRMLEDVKVRQVFVKVSQFAAPEDTIIAYKKALELRERLLKGESWDTIAKKYSDDRYSKTRGGNVGYLTAFQIYFPIEIAIYKLKVNEISMPVRSATGFHVIQLLERRPSRGEIRASHIMVAFPENASPAVIDSATKKINDIYKRVKAGEDFADLAKKYSDDHRSAKNGGDLDWFGAGKMIPEFENAAFALAKDGDFSTPVKSSFGYHIIKRIAQRPQPSYEKTKDWIKQRFQSDDRSKLVQDAYIAKVKGEIGFKDDPAKANLLLPLFDSTVFKAKWDGSKAKDLNTVNLFKLGNNSYSVKDLAQYIVQTNHARRVISFKLFLDNMYKDFVDNKIIDYQKSHLEQNYPDFKFLVQEYHDGILLFNLMEDKIWNQAAKDSVGLDKFYQENKDLYKWGERLKALVVTSTKKSLIDEAYKLGDDYNSGKINAKDILNKVCKSDSTKTCISVTDTLFEKGDNLILDSIGWKPGISQIVIKEGKFGFFIKKSVVAPSLKKLDEVKGVCIADYQAYLEKIYLAELRKKYKVVVNEKLLDNI
jgi:peptidyl-prolyl cis-trans isomerase SurA